MKQKIKYYECALCHRKTHPSRLMNLTSYIPGYHIIFDVLLCCLCRDKHGGKNKHLRFHGLARAIDVIEEVRMKGFANSVKLISKQQNKRKK